MFKIVVWASIQPEQLVDLRISREERFPGDHLSKDAAQTPGVHTGAVELGSHQYLRSSVPEGHYLVSVGPHWEPERPRQTEVCQLDVAVSVNQ